MTSPSHAAKMPPKLTAARRALSTLIELCNFLERAFQTPHGAQDALVTHAQTMYRAVHNAMLVYEALIKTARETRDRRLEIAAQNVQDGQFQLRDAVSSPENIAPHSLEVRRVRINKARIAFQRAMRALNIN